MNMLWKVRRTLLQADDTHDVQLGDVQDNELQCLIREIEESGQSHLKEVFREANESGEGVEEELH